PPPPPLFPYTPLFRSSAALRQRLPFLPSDEAWEKERARLSAHDPQHLIDEVAAARAAQGRGASPVDPVAHLEQLGLRAADSYARSEEHTSELQSRFDL